MDIILYLTPASPQGKKAKEWLKKKKVAFQERDISESETYRDEVIEKTSQLGVPVIEIDTQIIVGFKEQELEVALKKVKVI